MKRLFACIVSLVTALVMCFAFVACDGQPSGGTTPGGTTPGGTTPTEPDGKDGMAAKAINAVRGLLDENGFKGTVGYKLSSDGAKDAEKEVGQTVAVEKRGNTVRASYTTTDGEENVLFDLDTGYEYSLKEVDGALEVRYSNSILPAGLYDYVQNMLGMYATDDGVQGDDELIEYDAATKTVSAHTDMAEKLNEALEPLYTTYKSGSLVDLLDAYVEYFSDGAYTFSSTDAAGVISIFDLLKSYVTAFKEMDIGTVLDTAEAMGLDIRAMLEENGIDVAALLAQYGVEITDEQLAARTLGQIVVGAYNAIGQFIGEANAPATAADGDVTQDDDQTQQGGGMEAVLPELLGAVLKGAFVDDVDGSTAETVFDEILEMLDALKVKALIDGLADRAPELVAVVANGVEFKKLSADVSVKLDDADKLSELKLVFELAHDYEGDTTDFTVLADNNYAAEFTVTVTEHIAVPQAFEYTFADGYSINTYSAGAIVYGEVTEDVKVFVEFGPLDVKASVTGVYKTEADYTMTELTYGDNVTYDPATSVITIKAAFYNEFLATAVTGDELSVELSVDPVLSSTPVYVNVVYLTEEPQSLFEYIFEKVKNSIPPDIGDDTVPPSTDTDNDVEFAA